jgi:hypothetical protein
MHVLRVVRGEPLYVEPSPEFMPFLYAPGYYFVGALATKLLGFSFLALRLVSALSAAACAVIIFFLVRFEGAELGPALAGSLLFVGTFRASGGWFDLARVDSLALALSLGALLVARRATRMGGFACAGVVAGLAVLTKQSALVALPVCATWAFLHGRLRPAAAVVGGFFAVVVPLVIAFEIRSHGWFWYYLVELPATHGIRGRELLVDGYWREEIFRPLPVAATCAVLLFAGFPLTLARVSRMRQGIFVALFVLGAYAARLHMGSSLNDLMPAHAALSVAFGLTLQGLSPGSALASISSAALACVQFALIGADLRGAVPDGADYAAGARVVKAIHDLPGDVLVVDHPHLAWLAGKKPYAHQMAYIDVYDSESDPRGVRKLLDQKWLPLLESAHFSVVILDNDWYVYLAALRNRYVPGGKLPLRGKELVPKTGTPIRPELLYVPRW